MKKRLNNIGRLSNTYRKCFCIFVILCIIISTTGITTFAASDASSSNTIVSAQHINNLKSKILTKTETVENMQYKEVIENVSVFKKAVLNSYPTISDYELGKEILMALGDSEDFIDSLPTDKVLEAVNYTSAIRTQVYLKETSNGELIEISEKQYYSPNVEIFQNAISTNDYDKKETYGDIIIRSIAYERSPSYALSGRNYYTIRGEVVWEGYPNIQMRDLLVISSTGNIDNNYSHYATGKWTHTLAGTVTDTAYLYDDDGGDGTYVSLSTPSMYGMGAEFPLSIGQQNQISINKVYAYYGVSAQKDITCQVSYAHSILAWSPSFSISSSGDISFGGLGIQRQVFHGTAFTLYYN